MKNNLIYTIGIIFSMAFLIGCNIEHKSKEENIVKRLSYNVLNEDIYDIPLKTQVTLKILVSGKISKIGLEKLLKKIYASTKNRKGFKYHNSPTNIYIYAFISKDRVGTNQWIAMLRKAPQNNSPIININERQINSIYSKPEERFGLTEEKRKEIYKAIYKAQDRATMEAENAYPSMDKITMRELEKMSELEAELNEKYMNEVTERYKITREQLEKIRDEGIEKDWVIPPSPF